jgi:hypothetical protein
MSIKLCVHITKQIKQEIIVKQRVSNFVCTSPNKLNKNLFWSNEYQTLCAHHQTN